MRRRSSLLPPNPATTIDLVERAVAVLDNKHEALIKARAISKLGPTRAPSLGPVDQARNPLRTVTGRINQALSVPPLVEGLPIEAPMGQPPARAVSRRYARLDGRPLPPEAADAITRALKYRWAVGLAGVRIGWSDEGQIVLTPIRPDHLRLTWHEERPGEPTGLRYERNRLVGDRWVLSYEYYDISDIGAPTFRVEVPGDEAAGKRLTADVLGDDAQAGWPMAWRMPPTEDDKPGRPYLRIVTLGDPENVWDQLPAIEATINASVHWTSWGAAFTDAGHPQRNTVGLRLAGASTSTGGQHGVDVGPEVVLQWENIDVEKPGDHWQDKPGADVEVMARSLGIYEGAVFNVLGLPYSMESVGGDPTEQERKNVEDAIRRTYDHVRGYIGTIMQRAVAMAHAIQPDQVPAPPAQPYAVLLREEIAEEEQYRAEQAAIAAEASAAAVKTPMEPEA